VARTCTCFCDVLGLPIPVPIGCGHFVVVEGLTLLTRNKSDTLVPPGYNSTTPRAQRRLPLLRIADLSRCHHGRCCLRHGAADAGRQAPWRKVGLEQRPSGSVRGHLATHLNWILRMAQLLRGAHKCADEIDILGAIAAHGEREYRR
jgi:hypothetical protein